MATAVKNVRTLLASTSNGAGSTTNSATFDLSTAPLGGISARVTNGATGPTIACDFVPQISIDGGTTWRDLPRQTAQLGANVPTDFYARLPAEAKTARASFQSNTGQAVTVEAYGHELTSIG